MENYSAALQSLNDEKWQRLSVPEKLSLLQEIENETAVREGRNPCLVTGEFIPSDDTGVTLGYYNRGTRKITINTEQLEPQSQYGNDYRVHLDTILHEGRHAYQHQAVLSEIEHEPPEQVSEWRDNMAPGHYITYERNPRGYYAQPIERDARAFAAERIPEIEKERDLLLEKMRTQQKERPKILARNEDELREIGLRNIEDILEVRRDDLRDKGMVDGPEMEAIISRERIDLQTEFEHDAFGIGKYSENDRTLLEEQYSESLQGGTHSSHAAAREEIENQMRGKENGQSDGQTAEREQDHGISY